MEAFREPDPYLKAEKGTTRNHAHGSGECPVRRE